MDSLCFVQLSNGHSAVSNCPMVGQCCVYCFKLSWWVFSIRPAAVVEVLLVLHGELDHSTVDPGVQRGDLHLDEDLGEGKPAPFQPVLGLILLLG